MTYPIPLDALDDRLACVGTSGSGKTYAIGTAVEKLLHRKSRAIIADPLGVWWGLRLNADGKASGFNVVIIGGPHGDLPLTEHSGALIGEAAATMSESCILDLSELGTKASERRFMLGFLSALYRTATGEPVHLVLDEADMWAPQQLRDKEGEAAKLLGMMETIVRRGRIKGFIPWMITQRPAVLNKDVLSQVDGMIAMKLTATQDRNALDAWIEGSADAAEAKQIKADMPGLQLGEGIVWLPGRSVLKRANFPAKVTFDSSRTPKRGEARRTHTLKPLDVEALKGKLATVEAEVASSDPRKLKARIAELERQLKAATTAAPAPAIDTQALEAAAFARGDSEGFMRGQHMALRTMRGAVLQAIEGIAEADLLHSPPVASQKPAAPATLPIAAKRVVIATPPRTNGATPGLTPYQQKLLTALAYWSGLQIPSPTRAMVAAAAEVSVASSTFEKYLSQLRSAGLVDVPAPGRLSITPAGAAVAEAPPLGLSVRENLKRILTPYQESLLDALPRDGRPMSRDHLAEAAGVSAASSTFEKYLSTLKGFGLISMPERGAVAVEPWVWA